MGNIWRLSLLKWLCDRWRLCNNWWLCESLINYLIFLVSILVTILPKFLFDHVNLLLKILNLLILNNLCSFFEYLILLLLLGCFLSLVYHTLNLYFWTLFPHFDRFNRTCLQIPLQIILIHISNTTSLKFLSQPLLQNFLLTKPLLSLYNHLKKFFHFQ